MAGGTVRGVVVALAGGSLTLLGALPAGAVISGPCEAQATFTSDGDVYEADARAAEVTIPKSGTADWSGSISIPNPSPDMPYEGEIKLKFPPPLGEVTVRSWGGETERTANQGVDTFKAPQLTPGIEGNASGFHEQAGFRCEGSVRVKIAGGAGILGPVSILITFGAGATLAGAAIPKGAP